MKTRRCRGNPGAHCASHCWAGIRIRVVSGVRAMRGVTGPLLSLLLAAPAAAQTRTAVDSVDRYVRAELARERIPGMSIAVLRGDSLLLARGYGYANVEHHVPATDSTVYEVGSVSKQFTAAAVVMLSEQGRLSLDDPIVRFLPEGSGVWPRVTIRHLLTHTSGIPQDTMPDWRRDYTESELVRSAAAQPLDFEPGDHESYSSSQVTSGLRTSMPMARRDQIGGWLKAIHAWTFLGCDDVRKRGISRFGTRIERICYAKGAGSKASLLVTVLYGSPGRVRSSLARMSQNGP